MGPREALRQSREGAGTQWDPEIVALFIDLVERCGIEDVALEQRAQRA